MVPSDPFIFDNVIHMAPKVHSIIILLYIGSLNYKNLISEGHSRLLSDFPFVNLQIKSILATLRSLKSCAQ